VDAPFEQAARRQSEMNGSSLTAAPEETDSRGPTNTLLLLPDAPFAFSRRKFGRFMG
jgi:hypothetical protein